jgi:HK97 family phage portal protein
MAKEIGRFRASLIRWLMPADLQSGEFWATVSAENSVAGQQVNEKTALSLSAVWACSRLISETIGTLPYKIYEKNEGGRVAADKHDLHHILTIAPNANSTPSQFWGAIVASMLLRGNAFAEIKRNGGHVVALDFIHPAKLKPVVNDSGNITSYALYENGQVKRAIPVKNMLHIPAFGTDGRYGLSAISYGASVFGNALAAGDTANNTFKNGLSQTTALTLDRVLKKEQRQEYREALERIAGAVNAGKPTILEGGMDIKTIGINPKDAQLLESRSFSVEDICRWFGVDPSMVGHGNAVSNWGTGLEQKMIGFLTFTLRPLLTRIEQAVNKQLLGVNEQGKLYTEFSIEGLLRADSAGRAEFYTTMVTNGIMTRDEVRSKENMPLMGGNSAKQTVQAGFVPLETIGVKDND